MHWTGILNLIAFAFATAVAAFLLLAEGWHWYFAILIWPFVYIGLPVSIGLVQGIGIRHEQNKIVERVLDGDTEIVEKLQRGERPD